MFVYHKLQFTKYKYQIIKGIYWCAVTVLQHIRQIKLNYCNFHFCHCWLLVFLKHILHVTLIIKPFFSATLKIHQMSSVYNSLFLLDFCAFLLFSSFINCRGGAPPQHEAATTRLHGAVGVFMPNIVFSISMSKNSSVALRPYNHLPLWSSRPTTVYYTVFVTQTHHRFVY